MTCPGIGLWFVDRNGAIDRGGNEASVSAHEAWEVAEGGNPPVN